jgi:hypothetical protein
MKQKCYRFTTKIVVFQNTTSKLKISNMVYYYYYYYYYH